MTAEATGKSAMINGEMTHALYAGVGAAGISYALGNERNYQNLAIIAGVAAVANYVMNTQLKDSMKLLPHDMAAAAVSAAGTYFYFNNDTQLALSVMVGANNLPNVAAFLKLPQSF